MPNDVDGHHNILSLSLNCNALHLPLLRHLIDDPYFGQRLEVVGLDRDDNRLMYYSYLAELQLLGAASRWFVSKKKCDRSTTVSSSIDSRDSLDFPHTTLPTVV